MEGPTIGQQLADVRRAGEAERRRAIEGREYSVELTRDQLHKVSQLVSLEHKLNGHGCGNILSALAGPMRIADEDYYGWDPREGKLP